MRQVLLYSLIFLVMSADSWAEGQRPTLHEAWDTLLKQHVVKLDSGSATAVDYNGMAKDRKRLKQYLNTLSQVPKQTFNHWDKDRQLAFLINAYNAWTVEFVLTKYPNLQSIKDLGSFFSSPWKKAFIPLLGNQYSLDDIEHGMIRKLGVYDDPRIHFAVNCASIGCPALRQEAYIGEKLDQQLDEATKKFLASRNRNYFQGGTLYVSKIFDWYEEDFEQGWRGLHSLHTFLAAYSDSLGIDKKTKSLLQNGKIKIKFTKYDWNLNKK